MIRYAFFDWNGTLLADTTLRYHLANASAKMLGHPGITRAEHREHLVIPVKLFFKNIGIPDEVYEAQGAAERVKFHEAYEAGAAKARTRQGARTMLDELHRRGIRRIILSNHTTSGILAQLKRLRLAHHFDEILANDSIHTSSFKGKRDYLHDYLIKHRIDPAEAAIIGDTTEEIHLGKEFGLKTVAITGGIHARKRLLSERPDALINRLPELLKALDDIV
jgi:phosphoglycolate phosphatase